ncbi:MAG: hypothetical protein K6D90_04930 [Lachnospiraceae bacterium]|nr:hypothetical protein [Lachnospiraceae bacterium]
MNQNKSGRGVFKKLTGFTVMLLVAVLCAVPVFADGSITITADPEAAVVGDSVSVTYETQAPDGAADTPQVGISYDPNRLSLVDCDQEYSGGDGLVQLSSASATMTFSVLSGGIAQVEGSVIFDEDGMDQATGAATISVEGEDTAAALAAAAESSTGVEPGTIVSKDGSKIISTVFADEYMPPLFTKTTATYDGQTVEAASFDSADLLLLYVTDNTGENGNFNIYDQATETLSDFKMIQGIEDRYIIILSAPESVQAPNGFTKAALQWDGMTLEAYAVNAIDSAVITDVPATDFFLLYAISSEGNKGWYLYDQVGGTYQRYLPIANESVNSQEEEGGFLSVLTGGSGEETDYRAVALRRLIIIGAMAVVMIVMFIFLLNFFLKLRDYQSYDYIDEEEEEEKRQTVRREPSVEETSRIRASELARMEMGETFEPVDFDKLVNDPHKEQTSVATAAPAKSVTTPADAAAKLGTPPPQAANQAAPATQASQSANQPAAGGPQSAPANVAAAKAVAPAAPAPAAAPVQPKENTGINAASVSDFVHPANQAAIQSTPAAPAPAAPSDQATSAKAEFHDDYEDEADTGLFSRKSREEKKKEKKRKKALDFDEPEEIDWSSLEGTIKDNTDERRPKGGESPYSKHAGVNATAAATVAAAAAEAPANAPASAPAPQAAPQSAAPASAQTAPAAPKAPASVPVVETAKSKVEIPTDIPKPDHSKAVKPASQIHKETVPQQESGYWQQSSTQQYTEPAYAQDQQSAYRQDQQSAYQQAGNTDQMYDPYGQAAYGNTGQMYDPYGQAAYGNTGQMYDPYGQAAYGNTGQMYDPYGQAAYGNTGQMYDPYQQGYTQGYQQGYDPYGQYSYNPYGQNPYNTQNIDLDDDFEFEFIDIKR